MFSMKTMAAAAALTLLAAAGQAQAAITQITSPADYVGSTSKLGPAAGAVDGDAVTSVTDGAITATFGASTLLTAGTSWLTWGSAPDAEQDFLSETFPVFYTGENVTSVTFTFGGALLSAFGVELGAHGADVPLDPDEPYDDFGDGFGTFTAFFYRGGVLQGSVTREVYPFFDSKLFAATGAFDTVVIQGDDEFAFAQVRAAVAVVPEPTTWALMILGFGAAGVMLRRRAGALAA